MPVLQIIQDYLCLVLFVPVFLSHYWLDNGPCWTRNCCHYNPFYQYISAVPVQSGQGSTQKYQDLHSILVRESF